VRSNFESVCLLEVTTTECLKKKLSENIPSFLPTRVLKLGSGQILISSPSFIGYYLQNKDERNITAFLMFPHMKLMEKPIFLGLFTPHYGSL
jgi:hypothetical protein